MDWILLNETDHAINCKMSMYEAFLVYDNYKEQNFIYVFDMQ